MQPVTLFAVYEGERFAKICHTREEAVASIARWSRKYDWRIVAGIFTPRPTKKQRRAEGLGDEAEEGK